MIAAITEILGTALKLHGLMQMDTGQWRAAVRDKAGQTYGWGAGKTPEEALKNAARIYEVKVDVNPVYTEEPTAAGMLE